MFWKLLARCGLVRVLRHYLCCCCGRRAGPAEPHAGPAPAVPAAAAALPSVEVHRGYLDPEFAGPDATRAADTEFFQRRIRGRGAGRKPNDVLVKMPAGAARLQPDWERCASKDARGSGALATRLGRRLPYRPDRPDSPLQSGIGRHGQALARRAGTQSVHPSVSLPGLFQSHLAPLQSLCCRRLGSTS